MPRRTLLPVAGLALAAALTVGTAGAAAAHDELVSTDPAAGSTLATAPTAVSLTFSGELLDLSATVVAEGPQGAVAVGEAVVDGTTVQASMPDGLADGEYLVTWRVVSGDGHPIQGTLAFTLATGSTSAPGAATASAEPADPTPSAPPAPSTAPAAAPTSTPSATPPDASAPAPAPGGSPWPWVLVGVAAAGAVAALVTRRRRG